VTSKKSYIYTKILLKALHTNKIHILLISLFIGLSFNSIFAYNIINTNPFKNSNYFQKDSIINDSLNKPKELLDAIITHKAKDYEINDFAKNTATLYNRAELYYKDIVLKAGIIIINYKTNIAFAKGIIDSLGNYTQRPHFKQGNDESTQDSIAFNFKTNKAAIWGLRTSQKSMYITGDLTKRANDSTLYINKARFTTSKKDKPDYYIQANKIKVVPGKKIVTGSSNLVIADVPTPVFLPFSYFPITKGRASGFLLPTWGENNNQGYFLQNGGYYFAINDYVDLALLGDIYTNGSWGFRAESNYNLRYKYTGNFSFRYENLINSQRGLPNYSKATNFYIRWSHSQSSQSNPNSRFSSSVNFGSSQFFRQSLNEFSTPLFLTNTFSSSISYYRKFVGTPFNMTASLTQSQNTNTKQIQMSFPSLTVNMDRIYPFESKSGIKKNIFRNIGVTYNLKADYRINTTDKFFFKKQMFDNARTGIQHNAVMSTNTKVFKYFSLSPSANYKEVWYFKTINKRWDDNKQMVVIDTISGFKSFREYQTALSLSTTIYGTFHFKGKRLKAIRHTFTPTISLNYKPDFSFYYDTYQASADPNDLKEFSKFEGGIYGSPSRGISNNVSITLNNKLEAKIAPKDSINGKPTKITLLNNLNFSANYNIAADSLKWSPVRMNAGTRLFQNKLNLNLFATLDPYAINDAGIRINTFNINNGGSLFRLTSANISMSYNISNLTFSKNKGDKKEQKLNSDTNFFGGDLTNADKVKTQDNAKETKLYAAKIPWNFSLRYAVNYTNFRGEKNISSNSLQITGNVSLTPKWNVGISSGYDFKNKGIVYTQLRFLRDLDSWKLSFNWVPIGSRSTYYFFIGVKASVLSDLKYDKRKMPDKTLF